MQPIKVKTSLLFKMNYIDTIESLLQEDNVNHIFTSLNILNCMITKTVPHEVLSSSVVPYITPVVGLS